MLFLTRKRGEAVDIHYDGKVLCVVHVTGVSPSGVVRLGFDAGPAVKILRDNAGMGNGARSGDNEPNGNKW